MGLKIESLGGEKENQEEADLLARIWAPTDRDLAEDENEDTDDGDDEEIEAENWLDKFVAAQNSALPKITKMRAGVRDPNRVNIFLDGRFAFSLDVTQVVDLGVKVGQEISPERLEELKDASEFGKLYQRTLEWVLTRPHSVREAKNYLRRRQIKRRILNRQREREEKKALPEIKEQAMTLVVERLIEKGYLNDEKFAAYYIENRYVRRGISHRRLRAELQNKGVEADLINSLLNQETRNEDEEIQKVIAKKRAKYDDRKLINYLVRQGFNYYLAKEAVEKSNSEEE